MKILKNTTFLALGFFCFFTTACNRANESTSTKISIQLPTTGILAQKDSIDFQTLEDSNTGDDNKWTGTPPSSIASFNCFAVAVSGPEVMLNRNSCGKKIVSSGGTATPGGATAAGITPFTPSYSFGPFVGAIYAGHDLDIEVASGSDRIVFLFGFHADSESACQDYRTTAFDQSKLSKPHLLGKSEKINLKPTAGTDFASVPITMSFDTEAWFDECSGPEFDNIPNRTLATNALLQMNRFPTNVSVQNLCTSVDVTLQDRYGSLAKSDVSTKLGITNPVTSVPVHTYAHYSDCLAKQDGATDATEGDLFFNVPSDTFSIYRWYVAPSVGEPTYVLGLDFTYSKLQAIPDTQITVHNLDPSGNNLDLTGPLKVIQNVCYKYEVSNRFFTGPATSIGLSGIAYSTAGVTVFSNSGCNLVAPPGISSASPYPLYAKFTTTGTTNISIASNGLSSIKSVRVYEATSNVTPTRAVVRDVANLPNIDNKCFGPFHLSLVNSDGIEVINSSAAAKFFTASTAPTNMQIVKDSCSGGIFTGSSIPPGSSNLIFYLKIPAGVNPANGTHTIHFTNPENLGYDFNFNID